MKLGRGQQKNCTRVSPQLIPEIVRACWSLARLFGLPQLLQVLQLPSQACDLLHLTTHQATSFWFRHLVSVRDLLANGVAKFSYSCEREASALHRGRNRGPTASGELTSRRGPALPAGKIARQRALDAGLIAV